MMNLVSSRIISGEQRGETAFRNRMTVQKHCSSNE